MLLVRSRALEGSGKAGASEIFLWTPVTEVRTMRDQATQPKSVATLRTMKPRVLTVRLVGWLLVLACSPGRLAAAPLRIYILTDLEGASGVYQFAQTREAGNPLGETAKEYLMGDIAALRRDSSSPLRGRQARRGRDPALSTLQTLPSHPGEEGVAGH